MCLWQIERRNEESIAALKSNEQILWKSFHSKVYLQSVCYCCFNSSHFWNWQYKTTYGSEKCHKFPETTLFTPFHNSEHISEKKKNGNSNKSLLTIQGDLLFLKCWVFSGVYIDSRHYIKKIIPMVYKSFNIPLFRFWNN